MEAFPLPLLPCPCRQPLQKKRLITQDIGGFRVPDDLGELVSVLVGILENPGET